MFGDRVQLVFVQYTYRMLGQFTLIKSIQLELSQLSNRIYFRLFVESALACAEILVDFKIYPVVEYACLFKYLPKMCLILLFQKMKFS